MDITPNNRLPVHYAGTVAYEILYGTDFSALAKELNTLGLADRKVCIVSDTHVAPLYMQACKQIVSSVSSAVTEFVFPAGEASKDLDTVKALYTHLIEHGFERRDYLLALGGGVVGDLTGYTAATYLRGIRFVQVPTTLLSMVDSSIGGKTGVDFDQYKNMVGAFHQPTLVYMNLNTLNTLPEREYLSGMGEIIKHGLIKDASYYRWLFQEASAIMDRKYEVLLPMIRESCKIKRDVVEKDPKETGERAILNFGHTLGHAVERLKDLTLLHGECVAIGMVASARISTDKGLVSEKEYQELIRILRTFQLPVRASGLVPEDIAAVAAHDKKMEAGTWKFILLDRIGTAGIHKDVTKEDAIGSLRKTEAL